MFVGYSFRGDKNESLIYKNVLRSSNTSVLLYRLTPYIPFSLIALISRSLLATTCKVITYVTATIPKLSETFEGISVTVKSGCKKTWEFIKLPLLTLLRFCAFAYEVSTYLFPDLSFYILARC